MNARLPARCLALPCFLAAVVCCVSAADAAALPSAPAKLSNELLSMSFHEEKGGLVSLTDPGTGMEFLEPGAGVALWVLDFLPGHTPASVSSLDAGSYRSERLVKKEPGLRLIWEGFDDPAVKGLRVEVVVDLEGQAPVSRWNIQIEDPGGLPVEKVRFPRVGRICAQPDERLAAPVWMGQLIKDPRDGIFNRPGRRLEWPYPGTLSLQCLAFYREKGPGLYLSCDDTQAFRKAFAFWGEAQRSVGYEMIHLPENSQPPRANYAPAYRALIGTFQGDWVTAAGRYREWGTRQEWARQSRLNRGLVPNWLLKTGLWVWNRGRSDQVLKPAESVKKTLGLPVSVFWHWWHGCPYDTGFPEYLPPREGSESFREAVAEAAREGINAIVYMNQRLWGMTTQSWKEKGAARYAVKTLDGTVRPEVYNIFTRQACASMCMATSFWRNTYADIAEEVVCDLGVSGIYMDQACSSLLCYDPTHGHPPGGGTFWMNGFRLLSNDIRNRTTQVRKVLLAGEGAGEAWLPYLDLMLTLEVSRERYAQPGDGVEVIPFFQAVYHDYGVTYGNYSALTVPPYDELWPPEYAPKNPLELLDRRYTSQFYLEQARTFVWGIQPTIANFRPSHLQDRPQETGYLLKLARLRYRGLKYLLHGAFLRPPRLDAPDVPVEISRLSIYAGRRSRPDQAQKQGSAGKEGDEPQTHARITTPGVLAGAWKARDGDVGIALASIMDRPVSLSLDLSPYGINRNDGVYIVDEVGSRKLLRSVSESSVTVELRPLGACLLELRRGDGL